MIIDGKGNMFEDRRKGTDKRKNTMDSTGGRRQTDRRKTPSGENKRDKRR